MRLFVDTSGWCAVYDRSDGNHRRAIAFWRGLATRKISLVTSDYVFDETVTLLRLRAGLPAAITFGDALLASRATALVEVDRALRDEAWSLMKRYDDKAFSFTDCTSFAIMKRLGLAAALGFDHHFRQMGFVLHPQEPA